MAYLGFVVAMAADIEFAAQTDQSTPGLRTAEFLIVSRWGARGEYLTVSRTGVKVGGAFMAPIGLTPRLTWFGLMLSEGREEEASLFLLLPELPNQLVVAGTFVPAEGHARLRGDASSLRLQAERRNAELPAPERGALRPAPVAMAWRVEATRRFWIGEFVEPP
jgi:hypothetical protein